jgi:hypothetical protein
MIAEINSVEKILEYIEKFQGKKITFRLSKDEAHTIFRHHLYMLKDIEKGLSYARR